MTTRRQFLRGPAGFALALPFLPSLAPRRAVGDSTPPRLPRFVAMTTDHGACRETDMFPSSMPTVRAPFVSGHDIAIAPLSAAAQGARTGPSTIVSAAAGKLTARMLARMNILRGLDVPAGHGHQNGSHLGNFFQEDKDVTTWVPSIDQLIAWSPSFYPQPVRARSLLVTNKHVRGGGFSFFWEKPVSRSGRVIAVDYTQSSLALFDAAFGTQAGTVGPMRKPVVDAVLADYKRLRDGDARLSTGDRVRLDSHMERLAEISAKLNVKTASCNLARPSQDASSLGDTYRNPPDSVRKFQLYNDVIAAALVCGASRVAVLSVGDCFSSFAGEWHGEVIHRAPYDASKYDEIARAYQLTFEAVFLDLAAKLDVDDAAGSTVLDSTLMAWSQESGPDVPHRCGDLPVVTIGSAGGAVKTGLYVDYRNRSASSQVWPSHGWTLPGDRGVYSPKNDYAGVMYAQWLVTILQAMGVPRSEWAPGGSPWFRQIAFAGSNDAENPFVPSLYASGVVEAAAQPLPQLAT